MSLTVISQTSVERSTNYNIKILIKGSSFVLKYSLQKFINSFINSSEVPVTCSFICDAFSTVIHFYYGNNGNVVVLPAGVNKYPRNMYAELMCMHCTLIEQLCCRENCEFHFPLYSSEND